MAVARKTDFNTFNVKGSDNKGVIFLIFIKPYTSFEDGAVLENVLLKLRPDDEGNWCRKVIHNLRTGNVSIEIGHLPHKILRIYVENICRPRTILIHRYIDVGGKGV